MQIFISWSGERSNKLANALRVWLPLILHYAEPWLSSNDIQAGERWNAQVGKKLEENRFGIIVLTPENLTASWILFEAGALAKSVENSRVIPLLYGVDVRNLTGPLSQFQSVRFDRAGLLSVVNTLNSVNQDMSIDSNRLEKLFTRNWLDIEDVIAEIGQEPSSLPVTRRTEEILEDLVEAIRNLDRKFTALTSSRSSGFGRRELTAKAFDYAIAQATGSKIDGALQDAVKGFATASGITEQAAAAALQEAIVQRSLGLGGFGRSSAVADVTMRNALAKRLLENIDIAPAGATPFGNGPSISTDNIESNRQGVPITDPGKE